MAGACSDSTATTEPSTPESSSTTTTTISPDTTTTTRGLTGVPADFARAVVEVNGMPLTVAVADTPEQWPQGLSGVEVLEPLDGMLFVFPTVAERTFWMQGMLFPLDVAFFDADGHLVSVVAMDTCPDGDCPNYSSDGLAQFALETPQGALGDLPADTRLVVIGGLDGIGKEI